MAGDGHFFFATRKESSGVEPAAISVGAEDVGKALWFSRRIGCLGVILNVVRLLVMCQCHFHSVHGLLWNAALMNST